MVSPAVVCLHGIHLGYERTHCYFSQQEQIHRAASEDASCGNAFHFDLLYVICIPCFPNRYLSVRNLHCRMASLVPGSLGTVLKTCHWEPARHSVRNETAHVLFACVFVEKPVAYERD